MKCTCTCGHLQDRMILSIICFIDTNVQQCRGKQIKRGGGLKRNIDKQEKVRMVISNFAKERRNFLVWFLFNEQNIDSTFRIEHPFIIIHVYQNRMYH